MNAASFSHKIRITREEKNYRHFLSYLYLDHVRLHSVRVVPSWKCHIASSNYTGNTWNARHTIFQSADQPINLWWALGVQTWFKAVVLNQGSAESLNLKFSDDRRSFLLCRISLFISLARHCMRHTGLAGTGKSFRAFFVTSTLYTKIAIFSKLQFQAVHGFNLLMTGSTSLLQLGILFHLFTQANIVSQTKSDVCCICVKTFFSLLFGAAFT